LCVCGAVLRCAHTRWRGRLSTTADDLPGGGRAGPAAERSRLTNSRSSARERERGGPQEGCSLCGAAFGCGGGRGADGRVPFVTSPFLPSWPCTNGQRGAYGTSSTKCVVPRGRRRRACVRACVSPFAFYAKGGHHTPHTHHPSPVCVCARARPQLLTVEWQTRYRVCCCWSRPGGQ